MIEDWDTMDKNLLTSSFTPSSDVLIIPKSSYQTKKSCPYCRSFYLTDTHCEACGKSLVFDPVGEPFSNKSFFAIKERYIEDFDVVKRFYPVLESIESKEAKKYVRNLKKRLIDLLDYFQFREVFYDDHSLYERKIFFSECLFIIEEILSYGEPIDEVLKLVQAKTNGVLSTELIRHSREMINEIKVDRRSIWNKFIDQKLFETISVKTLLILFLFGGSLIGASLFFRNIMVNLSLDGK